MIKNEKQYGVSRKQRDLLERALTELSTSPPADVHPALVEAEAAALRFQIGEIQSEITDYELLKSGEAGRIRVDAFCDLPRALIRARIAQGLTHSELAARIGVKEQQIQRYEASEYASASFSRLNEIAHALSVEVAGELVSTDRFSVRELFRRLSSLGLDRAFVTRRILPRRLRWKLSENKDGEDTLALEIASCVSRMLKINTADLMSKDGASLALATPLPRFKLPRGASDEKLHVYASYVHTLSTLLLKATSEAPVQEIPVSATDVRERLVEDYGGVNFEAALTFVWDQGIPVLPLRDSGTFHGATYRHAGRNVIVLKQRTQHDSRWLFDLLHEYWHAAQEPEIADRFLFEADDEVDWQRYHADSEEGDANQFASDVILTPSVEELLAGCRALVPNRVGQLKSHVRRTAINAGVPVGAFANYVAYSLAPEVHWWAAATNLNKEHADCDPYAVAVSMLVERANLALLDGDERDVVLSAVMPDEELTPI